MKTVWTYLVSPVIEVSLDLKDKDVLIQPHKYISLLLITRNPITKTPLNVRIKKTKTWLFEKSSFDSNLYQCNSKRR